MTSFSVEVEEEVIFCVVGEEEGISYELEGEGEGEEAIFWLVEEEAYELDGEVIFWVVEEEEAYELDGEVAVMEGRG